jgi:hypothetical protein
MRMQEVWNGDVGEWTSTQHLIGVGIVYVTVDGDDVALNCRTEIW